MAKRKEIEDEQMADVEAAESSSEESSSDDVPTQDRHAPPDQPSSDSYLGHEYARRLRVVRSTAIR